MQRAPTLLLLLTLSWLTACTTTPPTPKTPITAAMQQQLAALENWQLKGKIGYCSGSQAGSAWLDWQQQTPNFTLNLSGPFGAGTTVIESSPQGAMLSRSGQPTISAGTPTALTYQLFGWHWPVEQLRYWAKGIPAPEYPVTASHYNDLGLLTQLQQSGWALDFSNHREAKNGLILPGKIIGQRDQLRFTLVIKQWLLDQ